MGTVARWRRHAALGATMLAVLAAPQAVAQQGAPPAAGQAGAEMTSRTETVTFKAAVQLVTIPVVVRDAQGRALGNLGKDDFQLFDNGKPQVIAKFSVERAGGVEGRTAAGAARAPGSINRPAAAIPERYIAYVFDDLHLGAGDLMRVRDAAARRLASSLRPADRAAIYSTSGATTVEFTADQDLLRAGLATLMPRPRRADHLGECPDITLYQADMMVNKNDAVALNAAIADARQCNPGASQEALFQMATLAARRMLNLGEEDARRGIEALRDAIRALEVRAGQRSIILVSPGFLKPGAQTYANELTQYAIQAKVTIGALDARGLWTDPGLDASQKPGSADSAIMRSSFASSSASAESNVMAELADATGGRFFENSNDLDAGLQQLAAAPEFVYELGFAPQNLKLDGKYHPLKVKLAAPKGLNVQARLGYFAPQRLHDAAAQAKEEVRNALFSREELKELPVELLARGFKQPAGKSQIIVWARVSLKEIKLRLADGRSCNEVKLVSAVFDADGKMVAGQEQVVDMRLSEATLAANRETGLTLRSDFIVKPGPYLVRMVVRDAEGQQITAQNSSIDAP
jgi:VWFA-related protein